MLRKRAERQYRANVDGPSGTDHVTYRLAADWVGSDQGERGQPALICPKLTEQRYFDRDLLGGVGAGKSRRDDGLNGIDVACLFTSYQHGSAEA